MKSVIAIRHVNFENLGAFETVFDARGWRVEYVNAYDNFKQIESPSPSLLVILGGPISVYDDNNYSFLRDELLLIERRLRQGAPILGICLGAQLVARSLGARVYPGNQKEIGWAPLVLTEAGRSSCLRYLAEDTPVLHWHGDTFDLPDDAIHLARTSLYENQAFRWGEATLALQFHLETTPYGLEQWFVGHACEIAMTPGVTANALRYDTRRFAAQLVLYGKIVLSSWLESLGL